MHIHTELVLATHFTSASLSPVHMPSKAAVSPPELVTVERSLDEEEEEEEEDGDGSELVAREEDEGG